MNASKTDVLAPHSAGPEYPDAVAIQPCCVLAAPLSEASSARVAKLMKALSDPVRVRLLSLVASSASGEVCACDFPAVLGKSQPTISHHLSQLVAVDILEREQRGKWAWFSLGAGLSELRSAFADVADAPAAD